MSQIPQFWQANKGRNYVKTAQNALNTASNARKMDDLFREKAENSRNMAPMFTEFCENNREFYAVFTEFCENNREFFQKKMLKRIDNQRFIKNQPKNPMAIG
jgi:hypothetical protein